LGISQWKKERSTLAKGALTMSWSIRSREGSRTHSIEELLWFHLLPGGALKVATHEEGLESEEFDYFMLSGLGWLASMAIAADSAAAASAAGTVSTLSEWKLMKNVQFLRMTGTFGRHVPMLAAPAAGLGFAHATVSDPVFQQTGKPFWMPLPLWVAYSNR
jgi:hypothetical protein